METYSGFVLEANGGLYEGGCVLEVKGYLYCIRPSSSGDGCVLEIPARDFNVLVTWEKVVGDVVDGDAVDGTNMPLGLCRKGRVRSTMSLTVGGLE